MKRVRTRFAPSPTGYLHIGGLRTALWAFLHARKNNGDFLLRIEDTDQKREVEGSDQYIIDALSWVDIEIDEGPNVGGPKGPYKQSERKKIYKKYADELVKKGHAYPCFCSKARLDQLREKLSAQKMPTMYDKHCLHLSKEEVQKRLENNEPHVIRMNVPRNKNIAYKDIVRGKLSFSSNTVDDQVLMKSDGFPTYHLAHVVDDHLMEVTHVIRGEEWLPSTPKHILLFEAFGWEIPEYAHLSLILNPDGTKLSKRQGDVAVMDYKNKGYIKQALLNFMVLVGWTPEDEQEILSMEELKQKFDLYKVSKAGAVFDRTKLNWFNWQWKRKLFLEKIESKAKELDPNVEILQEKRGSLSFKFQNLENSKKLEEFKSQTLFLDIQKYLPEEWDKEKVLKALPLVQEKVLKEPENIAEELDFIFEFKDYDTQIMLHEKMNVDIDMAKKALEQSEKMLTALSEEEWNISSLRENALKLVQSLNIKNGQLLFPLRAALSGKQFSPGAFECLVILGKQESLNRIAKGLEKF